MLKENGITVGRTSESQWTASNGTIVSKNNLQPGDVVFFKNTYNSGYKDGVSHVGVYVGNGKFVHNSSSAGGVTTSDLNSSYYSGHYLGAKRFVKKNEQAQSSQINLSGNSGLNVATQGSALRPTKDADGNEITMSGDALSGAEKDALENGGKLKWWGELLVLLLTVIMVVVCIIFFLKSFGIENPLKGGISNVTKLQKSVNVAGTDGKN